MLRGIYVYRCRKCKRKFWGADIEYMATSASMPCKCPYCGSTDTTPTLWNTLKGILHPGSVTNIGEKQ